MRFDLDHGRLDPRGFVDVHQFAQIDVRQSNGAAPAAVDQFFHCPPGVQEGRALVVDYISLLVPRILVDAGFEGERGVDQIEIEIVEAKPSRLPSNAGRTRSGR